MRASRFSSSVIERAVYDEGSRTLRLWFRETGLYIYSDVPGAVYEALCRAASAGGYFNQCIKGRFKCRPDPERRKFRPAVSA